MAKQQEIRNLILKMEDIDWRNILPLQPDDIKINLRDDEIEESIRDVGFGNPFVVWEHKKKLYSIDGVQRKRLLDQRFDNVPDKLPAIFVDAKDKEDAIIVLLKVFNKKESKIKRTSLDMWLEDEGIEMDAVAYDDLDFGFEMEEQPPTENQEESPSEPTIKIVLEYTEQDGNRVKDSLNEIAGTYENAVWQLLGFEDEFE